MVNIGNLPAGEGQRKNARRLRQLKRPAIASGYARVCPCSGACLRIRTRRTQVRKKRLRPRRGPDRSPEYLAWIRTLGCVVCSRLSGAATVIEAAHTNALGPRGIGQKTSDFSAIPLCSAHHRENLDSYHLLGEKKFSH